MDFHGAKKFLRSLMMVTVTKVIAHYLAAIIIAIIATDFIAQRVDFFKNHYVLMFLLLAFIFCVIANFFLRRSDSQPIMPPMSPDFRVVSRTITYKWLGDGLVEYRRKYRLSARRNGLDRYTDRWIWTGDGAVSMESAVKSHSLVLHSPKGAWNIFDVVFNKTLNISDEIDVEVVWLIKGIVKKPNAFCSATISEPSGTLRFRLEFRGGSVLQRFVFEHMHSMSAKDVISQEEKDLDGEVIEFEVVNPELLHHYQVRWNWI